MDNKNLILEWDEFDIFQAEVKRLMEEEGLGEKEAQNRVWEDSDLFAQEWECFTDNLGEELEKRANGSYTWRADGRNMGWQHRSGYKMFRAKNALEFLDAILPKTECHIQIFKSGRRGLSLRVSHHDAPTGEWYEVRPLTKKEYEDWDG
jgi:hypothetical protein